MANTTKTLNTRIQLKYDTFAEWTSRNPKLLKGEIAVVYIPAQTSAGEVTQQPATVFKVGDGVQSFNDLPFSSSLAADVYAWAKKAQGAAEDIKVLTEGHTFNGKTVSEALKTLNDNIGALTGDGTSGSISEMIDNAINDLDVSDTAESGKYVSAISQVDGKIQVTRASLPDYSNTYASKSIESTVSTIENDYLKSTDKTALESAINGKVDKKEGYSLISDSEIKRLAEVENYNDEGVKASIQTNANNISAILEGSTAKTIKAIEDSIAGVKATAEAAAVKTEVETALNGKQDTIAWMNDNYDTETNKAVTASDLNAAVAGLSGAMHFEGVKDSIPTNNTGYESGDVILVGNKEYVFDGTDWHELGDESIYAVKGSIKNADIANDAAIAQSKIAGLSTKLAEIDTAIETAKSNANSYTDTAIANEVTNRDTAIATAKQEAIDAAAADATTKANQAKEDANSYADGLAVNYATATQGTKADSAIQGITTTANKGLKVSQTETTVNIDIDDTITWIFNCGSASTVLLDTPTTV